MIRLFQVNLKKTLSTNNQIQKKKYHLYTSVMCKFIFLITNIYTRGNNYCKNPEWGQLSYAKNTVQDRVASQCSSVLEKQGQNHT